MTVVRRGGAGLRRVEMERFEQAVWDHARTVSALLALLVMLIGAGISLWVWEVPPMLFAIVSAIVVSVIGDNLGRKR